MSSFYSNIGHSLSKIEFYSPNNLKWRRISALEEVLKGLQLSEKLEITRRIGVFSPLFIVV